jgi:hypothetical protein
VFARSRIGAAAGYDIWRIDSYGSGLAAVTQPFPTGASFATPTWAPATIPAPASQATAPPLAIPAPAARTLELPHPPTSLTAGSGRAAFEPTDDPASPLAIWSRGASYTLVRGSACDYNRWSITVAGRRAAWLCDDLGDFINLESANVGSKASQLESVDSYANDDIDDVAGDGNLLVYEVSLSGREPTLWRIDPSGHTRMLSKIDGDVVAVDSGRIAVLGSDHKLEILSGSGRRLAAYPLGPRGVIEGIRLAGPHLVVLRNTVIEVRDAATGRLEHSWPTAPVPAPLALAGAHGDLAIYTAGIAIHVLRLSDGRDRLLTIADEAPPVSADFAREGLYYSYARTGHSTGRLAFIPLRRLVNQL